MVGDYVVYGTDNAAYESTGTAKILSRNKLTGELMDVHDIVGDQRSSIAYADGKVYFTTKAGYLYSAELGKDGKLNNLKGKNYTEYGLMSTSTPVVYNGYVYFGIAKANFSAPYNTMMVDANTLDVAASVAMQGYPQCSMLLSTAYEKSTGKIYLYSTYNNNPGGITAIEVDQAAKTMTATEIYTPSHPQYCITSLICDGEGTIYYKNDSGYLFAVKLADSVFVKDVEDLINAIGKVEFTDECKAKIDAARAAYDKLTDAQKKLVKNLKVLTDAEAEYERLKKAAEDEAAAKAVDDLIAAIGKVEFTDESKGKIDAARAAYDKLTDAQKKLVKNLKVLTDAEAEYERLKKAAEDEAAAKAVDDLIAAIGEVKLTEECDAKIKAARKAFNALTPEQKAFVKNEKVLTDAEAEYARLVKEAEDKAAAKAVDDLIAAIGEVKLTEECDAKIKAARKAFNALTPEQKAFVKNEKALTDAEAEYQKLFDQHKADEAAAKAVDEAVAKLAPVTLESGNAVKAARKAFDELTPAQRKLLKPETENNLKAAEAEYARLVKEAEDKAAAKAVDEAVAKLAPVTLESGNAIEAARKAFNELTPAQRNFLAPETESNLKAAEAEYARLVKDAADKAAAKEVEDKIARLQPVTKDSGEAIKDARSSYEALTPEQKALVSKDSVAALDKAEKVYDMIIASTKPGTAVGDKTGSTSGSGVIKITANAAAKGEQNPHTGAPVMSMAPAVLVLAAAALVLKKHK